MDFMFTLRPHVCKHHLHFEKKRIQVNLLLKISTENDFILQYSMLHLKKKIQYVMIG